MADIKNTFLKSRMNKDLDARLVPNGEYRDAQNINVNKSEGPDVGAIENIIGNSLVTNFGLLGSGISVIGSFFDNINERVYAFVTNYTDSSVDSLSNNCAAYPNWTTNSPTQGVVCSVVCYEMSTSSFKFLVFGSWLNFSLTHPVLGVNLIENQLFWTDNRNQPRKLNVDKALENPYELSYNGYPNTTQPFYQNEDQVSVAKYYPYKPIELVIKGAITKLTPIAAANVTVGDIYDITSGNGEDGQIMWTSSSGDAIIINPGKNYDSQFQQSTPGGGSLLINADGVSTMKDRVSLDLPTNSVVDYNGSAGGSFGPGSGAVPFINPTISTGPEFNGCAIRVIDTGGGASTVPEGTLAFNVLSGSFKVTKQCTFASGAKIVLGANPDYDVNYQGDEDVLKEDFVKFAYRIKFTDNEYSLISPFTQPCFIPKQNGYFVGDDFIKTYESTLVSQMENLVNSIEFLIPGPDRINGTTMKWGESLSAMHVDSIELLWKNASGTNIRILDTIPSTNLSGKFLSDDYYTYKYVAKKPIKTLPEFETTRTSDKVPIRAKAQESVGNRIVYGNYVARKGRPEYLDYSIQIGDKFEGPQSSAIEINTDSNLKQAYPQSSVKQNRTYQVGIVLVDRYGRQSDVILSENDLISNETGYRGSTYFHYYRNSGEPLRPNVNDIWCGDSIKVLFENAIPEAYSVSGYAGLYKTDQSNPTGWYTYKIVVKQPRTDYYNAYLPGILNNFAQRDATGFSTTSGAVPDYPPVTSTKVANIVLIGDNINKIPRELQDVGPEQREFASDVDVYGRVDSNSWGSSTQYYPNRIADTVSLIGTYTDLNYNRTNPGIDGGDEAGEDWITWTEKKDNKINSAANTGTTDFEGTIAYSPFFNVPGNTFDVFPHPSTGGDPDDYEAAVPFEQVNSTLIAKINTSKKMGILGGVAQTASINPWDPDALISNTSVSDILWYARPPLSVLEIKPTSSDLDIYYESSTGGKINELNQAVTTGDTWTPRDLEPLNFSYRESQEPSTVVSDSFYPLGAGGVQLNSATTTLELTMIKDGNGTLLVDSNGDPIPFEVEKLPSNQFRLKIKAQQYIAFVSSSPTVNVYSFTFLAGNVNPNTGATVVNVFTLPVAPTEFALSNDGVGWEDNGGDLGGGTTLPSSGSIYYGNSLKFNNDTNGGFSWPWGPWLNDVGTTPQDQPYNPNKDSTFYGQNMGLILGQGFPRAIYAGSYQDPIKAHPSISLGGTNDWLPVVALNGFNGSFGTGIGPQAGIVGPLMKQEIVWNIEDLEFWWTGRIDSGGLSSPAWQSFKTPFAQGSGSTTPQVLTQDTYKGVNKNSRIIEISTAGDGQSGQGTNQTNPYFTGLASNQIPIIVGVPVSQTGSVENLVRLADFGTQGLGPQNQLQGLTDQSGNPLQTVSQAYSGVAETIVHKLRGLAHWFSDLNNVYAAYPAPQFSSSGQPNFPSGADQDAMFGFKYKAYPQGLSTLRHIFPQMENDGSTFGAYNYGRFLYYTTSTEFPAVEDGGNYGTSGNGSTPRPALGNYVQSNNPPEPPPPAPGTQTDPTKNHTLYRITLSLKDANGLAFGSSSNLYVHFVVSNTETEVPINNGGTNPMIDLF